MWADLESPVSGAAKSLSAAQHLSSSGQAAICGRSNTSRMPTPGRLMARALPKAPIEKGEARAESTRVIPFDDLTNRDISHNRQTRPFYSEQCRQPLPIVVPPGK